MSTPEKPKADVQAVGDSQFRFIGDHAVEIPLDDGTLPWVGPGDFITLSSKDAESDKVKDLLDNGLLIPVS
jgi:hypothetical protein